MRSMNPYLNFGGNCEDAFEFYRSVFGGKLTVQHFKDAPTTASEHTDAPDMVLHASLTIAPGLVLMGSDRPPAMGPVTPGNNVHISLAPESEAETTRVFNALAEGGQVTMPLQQTFWNAYFGMLTDKFGVHWMVNYEPGK